MLKISETAIRKTLKIIKKWLLLSPGITTVEWITLFYFILSAPRRKEKGEACHM